MGLRNRLQRAWTALTRPERRGVASPFDGADVNRLLSDWVTLKMHPDDESRFNLDRLKVRARDLERNSPLAKNFLRLVSVNVIGPHGFAFSARVRDNSGQLNTWINERLEQAWERWGECPTLDRKLDLAAFSRLALRTVARDGEILIRKWRGPHNDFGFAIEAIDPDQLDQLYNRAAVPDQGVNEIRMGVEVDQFSRPLAYWLWDKPERTFTNLQPRNRIRVPADEIIHLYDPDRVNQTRGITWFAPVMVSLRMLEAYREAELVAARIHAASVGFFTRKSAEGAPPEEDDTGRFSLEMPEAGTFNVLPEGYGLEQFHADHPNSQFGTFVKDQIRAIATGLGVSYNGLTSDLESVNYSSMRSGLLIEREMWRTLQQWWIARFLMPLYRDWLNASLLSGGLKLDTRVPDKFYSVRFTPRGWPWVDPLKDTEAAVMGIQAGLMSREMALAEQGISFDEVLEDLKGEDDAAKQAGLDIAGPVPAGTGRPTVDKPLADAEPSANGNNDRALAILAARNGGLHR